MDEALQVRSVVMHFPIPYCRSMMLLIVSMKGSFPSAPLPTSSPNTCPPAQATNNICQSQRCPLQYQELCAETERLKAADVAATLLLSEKEEAIQGCQGWSRQRGTCRSSCGTPKWKCRAAWTPNETYPTSHVISLPLYMSISMAGILVQMGLAFEHETPFYLIWRKFCQKENMFAPRAVWIVQICYLVRNFPRCHLKATAAEGRATLGFIRFAGEHFGKMLSGTKILFCELLWSRVIHSWFHFIVRGFLIPNI